MANGIINIGGVNFRTVDNGDGTFSVSASGGGGGAVTATDGALVTLGAKADAAITDPTLSATEIALLKGILTKLGGAAGALAVGDGTNIVTVQTANADGTNNTQNNLTVTARLMAFGGATWDRVREVIGDAMAATGLLAVAHMLWNGATYDRAASDATGKAKVSLYGKRTVAGDTAIPVNALFALFSAVIHGGGSSDGLAGGSFFDDGNSDRVANIGNFLFNNTAFDRQRNNHEVTALASAARTAAVDSADLINYNARGVIVVVDVTVLTATQTLTVTIQGKDTLSGKYYTLLASSAIVAVGTTVLVVYPGTTASGNLDANSPLPRIWRIDVAVANGLTATYSVGANYIL